MEGCQSACMSCGYSNDTMLPVGTHNICSSECVRRYLEAAYIIVCPSCSFIVNYTTLQQILAIYSDSPKCAACGAQSSLPETQWCHHCISLICEYCRNTYAQQIFACQHKLCELCGRGGCRICQTPLQKCMICLEAALKPVQLDCRHILCEEDFMQYVQDRIRAHVFSIQCPDCKEEVSTNVLASNLPTALLNQLSDAAVQHGLHSSEKRM